jgi:hypothetical protein
MILVVRASKFFSKYIMSLWMHIMGWVFLGINTLCLLRLGVLPVIFFAKNFALYNKIFWVSLVVTTIFICSEIMLIQMLLTLDIE